MEKPWNQKLILGYTDQICGGRKEEHVCGQKGLFGQVACRKQAVGEQATTKQPPGIFSVGSQKEAKQGRGWGD